MSRLQTFDGFTVGDHVGIKTFLVPHRSGIVRRFEIVMTHPDGSPKWVFAHLTSDQNGKNVEVPSYELVVLP